MLEAISAGVPITQACLHAGISESAHFRAMEAGEQAQALHDAGRVLEPRQAAYREYREQIMRARAAVAVVHVALVGKAARGGQLIAETTRRHRDGSVETERRYAQGEWKASQFLLATSFREEFGAARKVEHTGPDGGPLSTSGAASEDAVRTLAERIADVAARQRGELPGGWEPGPDRPAIEAGPAERVDLDVADAELVEEGPR